MMGPVGPSIDNSGTSTAPYLDAMIFFSATALSSSGYTIRVAIHNRDQNAFSTVGLIVAPGTSAKGWVYVTELPCAQDSFNEFDIFLQCTKQSVSMFLHYVQISESADVEGVRTSRILSPSGATVQLGVVNTGVGG